MNLAPRTSRDSGVAAQASHLLGSSQLYTFWNSSQTLNSLNAYLGTIDIVWRLSLVKTVNLHWRLPRCTSQAPICRVLYLDLVFIPPAPSIGF